jgi:hypothetical protein
MPISDFDHVVNLDEIENPLIRFYPVEKLIRTSVYITWPLILLNAIIFGLFVVAFFVQLFGSGLGPTAPILGLAFVYLGSFTMMALNVAMSWFISTLKAERLAITLVIQLVFISAYTVINFAAAQHFNARYYTPLHLLTVSPVYFLYFLVAMIVIAWFVYTLASGIRALTRIPQQERFIARPEYFKSRFNLRTLERYGGLPPVVELLPRRQRLKVIFYFSSLCFVIAFYALENIGGLYFFQDMALRGICGSASNLDACLRANVVNSQVYVLVIGLVAIFAFPKAGNALLARMHKLSTYALNEMQRIDPRPPVLFLRAFRDDQVALQEPRRTLLNRMIDIGRPRTNLDQLVLDMATPYGPVVALGNPSDQLPPYGAARGYFDGKTWQQAVEQLGREAVVIVLCLDDTKGVWWEVDHLAQQKLLGKTLFLIHPKDAEAGANSAIVRRLVDAVSELVPPTTRQKMAELKSAAVGQPPVIGLFINNDGSTAVARSSTFSRLAFTLAMRWFLRIRLGLEPALARPGASREAGLMSPTALSIVWLSVGIVVSVGMSFVFLGLGLSFIPGVHPVDDGKILSGWIFGTALSVGAGTVLARRHDWRAGTAAHAIYWLGSAFLIGLLIWPMFEILRIASDLKSFLFGAAVFLANVAVFIWRSRISATGR